MEIFSQIGRDSNLPKWGESFKKKMGFKCPPGGKPDFPDIPPMQNHYPKLLAKFLPKLMRRIKIISPKVQLLWPFQGLFRVLPPPPGERLRFFYKKKTTSLSLHYRYATLCKKSEQSYERILRSKMYGRKGRTNESTNERR